MKPIIYILMLSLGMISGASAQSSNNITEKNPQVEILLATFMKAQHSNDVTTLRKLLSKDAVISIPGKTGELIISKRDYLAMVQNSAKEQQEGSFSYEISAATPSSVTAYIYFNYTSYSIRNLVKVEKGADDWRITELRKSFLPPPPPVNVAE